MKHLFLIIICLSSCNLKTAKENQNSEQANQNSNVYVRINPTSKTKEQPEEIIADIPNASWEKNYFEGINERTDIANLKSLRKTKLTENDLEIRVWIGFGITKLEGFILRRVKNDWSAIYLDSKRTIKLGEPNDGWDKTWKKLLNRKILSLPDAESIDCDPRALDGISFVFEMKKGESYRTYVYGNPQFVKTTCNEAEKVLEIVDLIISQFKINEQKNPVRNFIDSSQWQ